MALLLLLLLRLYPDPVSWSMVRHLVGPGMAAQHLIQHTNFTRHIICGTLIFGKASQPKKTASTAMEQATWENISQMVMGNNEEKKYAWENGRLSARIATQKYSV